MRFENFAFGFIRIDGITHENDVIIDRGIISIGRTGNLSTERAFIQTLSLLPKVRFYH
jgi:hypothetical protein